MMHRIVSYIIILKTYHIVSISR